MKTTRVTKALLGILGFGVVVGSWYVVSYFYSTFLVPFPHQVVLVLYSLIIDWSFLFDLGDTLYKTLVSSLISSCIGVPIGLLLGYKDRFRSIVEPLVDFFRSIPVIAAFPIFLLLFGLSDQSRIAIAVFSGSLIMAISSMYGVQNAKQSRVIAARTMKATDLQIFSQVVFPDAFPYIFAGLRQTLAYVLVIVLVTEMLFGGTNGLGYRISNYYDTYQIPQTYASIVIVGTVGYLLSFSLIKFEKKIVHWSGK